MKQNFSVFIINSIIFLTWTLLVVSILVDYRDGVLWRVAIWVILLIISKTCYFKAKSLSLLTHFIIALTILSAIFGELYLELYYNWEYYDKILHFLNPILILFISYDFLKRFFPKDKKERIKYAIYVTIGLVLLWEVAEIVFDYFFDSALVGVFVKGAMEDPLLSDRIEILSPWLDTLYDIILDFVGIVFGYFLIKKSNSK